jgi:hypothetical protein
MLLPEEFRLSLTIGSAILSDFIYIYIYIYLARSLAQVKNASGIDERDEKHVQKIARCVKLVAFIRSHGAEADRGSRGSLQGPSIVSIALRLPSLFFV